jgi:anionic cell wall polymer biosynthesis LytR-Cps2A-Psr (LCP) family protein
MDTLWFARARHDSDDYSRMARQKCVMSAMLQQVSPQVALRNFEKIAGASSAMVSTNVPRGEVDRFVDLALKAKSQKIASLSLVPPMVNTANPDIDEVHAKVAAAIAKAEGRTPEKPVETAEAAPADTQAPGTTTAPEATGATEDEATADAADDAPEGAGSTSPAPSAPSTPPAVTGGSLGSLSTGYAANQSEDLGAVC